MWIMEDNLFIRRNVSPIHNPSRTPINYKIVKTKGEIIKNVILSEYLNKHCVRKYDFFG